jgi:hypothetical protein
MNNDDLKTLITNVKSNLRITKVVATRSVKTSKGDFFAGFAAAWNSVQDDGGGPGADLDLVMTMIEQSNSGMTLKEASVAHNIVAMQADIAAFRAARANGALSDAEFKDGVSAVKNNYGRIIRDALVSSENGDT